MRIGMGLFKNEYGVWHVRRKVPKRLEVAVARLKDNPKGRVSWLKRTLGTKDEKRAKILAKPVMMEFDRIIAQAEALLVEHPVRTELTEIEIKQIADYFYAYQLGADEELRAEGVGSDPIFANVHRQLAEAGIEFETSFDVAGETGSGLSDRMMHKIEEDASIVLLAAKEALARGNINFIRYELNELLQLFRIPARCFGTSCAASRNSRTCFLLICNTSRLPCSSMKRSIPLENSSRVERLRGSILSQPS
jgi:hypothetical protein